MSLSVMAGLRLWQAIRAARKLRQVVKAARKRKTGSSNTVEVSEMNFGALKSKTVWFGIAQAVGAAALVLMQDGVSEASVTLFITSVVTIILRAVTDTPLSEK